MLQRSGQVLYAWLESNSSAILTYRYVFESLRLQHDDGRRPGCG